MDIRDARGYLAGIIDGEGHVAVREHRVVITNTEPEIIEQTTEIAAALGFRTSRWQTTYYVRDEPRVRYELAICGREACAILVGFPLASERKRERLIEASLPLQVRYCRGCGVPYDEATEGCLACYSRHWHRRKRRVA